MSPNPDLAQRRVVFAQWDPNVLLYTITFECGHLMECSEQTVASRMICMECLKEMLKLKT